MSEANILTKKRYGLDIAALVLLPLSATSPLCAASKTLDCVLTDVEIKSSGTKFESHVAAEQRPISVIFDDEAKTLIIKEGSSEWPLRDVAISEVSMTGAGADVSLGIDRSSWRAVFQSYAPESTRNEFGECRLRP